MKTDIVFVVDASGSMCSMKSDTIGGFNSMIEKYRDAEDECNVTTIFFNDLPQKVHDRLPIADVPDLTGRDYMTMGGTALLDAIGYSIGLLDERLGVGTEHEYNHDERKVVFVIITDGMENTSKRFGLPQIRSLVTMRQNTQGWEFLFLGAEIDAFNASQSLGMKTERTLRFKKSAKGFGSVFDAMGESLRGYVRGGEIDMTAFDRVERPDDERPDHTRRDDNSWQTFGI